MCLPGRVQGEGSHLWLRKQEGNRMSPGWCDSPGEGSALSSKALPNRGDSEPSSEHRSKKALATRPESLGRDRWRDNFDPKLIPACVKTPGAPPAPREGCGWEDRSCTSFSRTHSTLHARVVHVPSSDMAPWEEEHQKLCIFRVLCRMRTSTDPCNKRPGVSPSGGQRRSLKTLENTGLRMFCEHV